MNFNAVDATGRVDGFCLVKNAEKKTSSKGDAYLDLTLGDATGEINAKLWSYNPAEHGEYSSGDIVKVRGTISFYKETEQLRIERIRHVTESDNVKKEDLVRSSSIDSKDMYNALCDIANGFKDENLRKIVTAIYTDRREALLYWPAAFKLHHAIRGGLLMHVLSIVRMCEAVEKIYPFVDGDLLKAGAMLHDIAKIEEFEVNEAGTAEGYSLEGNLLGHLTMGSEIISRYAEKLGIQGETPTLLKHMVLSHHGLPEYGAAVRPMFIEAEILAELDLMDARLYEMKEAVIPVSGGSFSGRIWALDNVKLYNHGRTELDRDPELIK